MNHLESIATKATERYLMGDLLPDEQDAFEQHYFECPDCACDVRIGFEMVDGATTFFREAPAREQSRKRQAAVGKWRSWIVFPQAIPVAAAFALMSFTVYQNTTVIPALRAGITGSAEMQVLPSAVLVPAARSTVPSLNVAANAPFFQLSLELPPSIVSGGYRCELRDEKGKSLWTTPVSVRDAADNVSLLIPASHLVDGSYELTMKASGNSPQVNPFRFRLSRR